MERKYPIYLKYFSGKKYRKINNENESISIEVRKNFNQIIHSQNAMKVADALDKDLTKEITRDEWEKVYGETLWGLTKANQVQ